MKNLWLILLFSCVALSAADDPLLRATTPVARWETSEKRPGYQRFQDKKLQAQRDADKIKIVFLGDSITNHWEYPQIGKPIFEREFVPYGALNLGNSGDRTQHWLYIIEKFGVLETLHPKLIVILIGTNNLSTNECGAPETVAAIKKGVTDVRRLCPDAKILLFGIFPRGEGKNDPKFGAPIAEINAEIKTLADGENIFFCDLGDQLLSPDGTVSREIMPDSLHLSAKGYEIWASAIRPYVEKFVK